MAGAIQRKDDNGGARHELDKFYTSSEIAQHVVSTITELLETASLIVEPSAGNGAFLKHLNGYPNVIGYDLAPEHIDIQQKNWFDVETLKEEDEALVIIGNPPFGVRADLAKKFIKHAIYLNADTIGFILPSTFSKVLNQQENLFPKEYRLVIEETLPNNSFRLNGSTFHIPCGWYVWTKNETFKKGADLRKKKIQSVEDFSFLNRGNVDADFVLNGNTGKIKDLKEIKNPKSEHYIKVTDRAKVEEIRAKLSTLEYPFNSSVNGGIAWIGKQEILATYIKG